MRRVTAVLSAVAIVLSTVSILAQAKPDFSGKWTLVPDPAAAAPAGGGGGRGGGRGGGGNWGMNPALTQTATTLTVEYVGGGQNPAPMKLVYKLDGSASENPGRGGTPQVSKAVWTGATLVISTTTANGEQKRTLSLKGGNLVIDTSNPGRDGGPAVMSSMTFKKG